VQAALDNRRVLEIGYQRNYNPMYQVAYDGIVKAGLLATSTCRASRGIATGTGAQARCRRKIITRFGLPDFEHPWNWRLYNRYSRGLVAELASHEMNIVNWFFGAEPTAVMGTGGIYRFNDGREVPDHVYATWEYDGGRTAVFSSIESNAFDHYYEAFFGTKATLILQGEAEAYLFDESTGKPATGLEVTPKGGPCAGCRAPSPAPSPIWSSRPSRPARRPPAIGCWRTRTRSRPSVRPCARARRCCAARTARWDRPARASQRSRRSRRRRASRSRRPPRRGRSGAPDADAVARSRVTLVLLRTLIGWHFLQRATTSSCCRHGRALGRPSESGAPPDILRPRPDRSPACFMRSAPRRVLDRSRRSDRPHLVGLSLMLGLFTRAGCWGAMLMLALFYLSAIPLTGTPVPGQEGEYILVSKNLIELVAVAVILTSRTERIAGLDLLFPSSRTSTLASHTAA
jgi:hypothetical protein